MVSHLQYKAITSEKENVCLQLIYFDGVKILISIGVAQHALYQKSEQNDETHRQDMQSEQLILRSLILPSLPD